MPPKRQNKKLTNDTSTHEPKIKKSLFDGGKTDLARAARRSRRTTLFSPEDVPQHENLTAPGILDSQVSDDNCEIIRDCAGRFLDCVLNHPTNASWTRIQCMRSRATKDTFKVVSIGSNEVEKVDTFHSSELAEYKFNRLLKGMSDYSSLAEAARWDFQSQGRKYHVVVDRQPASRSDGDGDSPMKSTSSDTLPAEIAEDGRSMEDVTGERAVRFNESSLSMREMSDEQEDPEEVEHAREDGKMSDLSLISITKDSPRTIQTKYRQSRNDNAFYQAEWRRMTKEINRLRNNEARLRIEKREEEELKETAEKQRDASFFEVGQQIGVIKELKQMLLENGIKVPSARVMKDMDNGTKADDGDKAKLQEQIKELTSSLASRQKELSRLEDENCRLKKKSGAKGQENELEAMRNELLDKDRKAVKDKAEIDSLKKELKNRDSQMDELKKQLESIECEHELRDAEQEVQHVKEKRDVLNERRVQLEKEDKDTRKQLKEAEEAKKEAQKKLESMRK